MDDLICLLAAVKALINEEGSASELTDFKEAIARHTALKARPFQQTLFGNAVFTRSLAHHAKLGIKPYDHEQERTIAVEDIFLELAYDLLTKIVACLVVLVRCVEQGAASTSHIKLGPRGEVMKENELTLVRGLVWFIVCLGIHPFLDLPLHPDAQRFTSEGRRSSALERKQKMMIAVAYLRCLREHDELVPLLRSHHVHCPAVCALLEQAVCPLPAADHPELEHYTTMKEQARIWIDGLLEGQDSFDTLPQLFLLQNAAQCSLAKPNSKPRFVILFMEECGRLLSILFMRPKGVAVLLETVMRERHSDPVTGPMFQSIGLMAAVLSQFPQHHELTSLYYDSVVKQLRELITNYAFVGPIGSPLHMAVLFCLKTLSHLDTTIDAFNEYIYAPIRPFYEKGLADSMPVLEKVHYGRVIVEKPAIEECVVILHSLLTIPTCQGIFHFHSTAPLVALFSLASSMPVRSASRRMILDTLTAAVDQHSNPVSLMFAFIDSADDTLVPTVVYMSTKGHIVRRPEPGDPDWTDNMHNIYPPSISLLNPSLVHIMDLLVERKKEPNSPIIPGSSARHENDGSLASDIPWNRKCIGARIVATVMSASLVDLTKSLTGRQTDLAELTYLDTTTDVEPDITQDIERDFVRLNLVATISERYGPDIVPASEDVIDFASVGLAAAAFVLNPYSDKTDILDASYKSAGKTKVVGKFSDKCINLYPAQMWSLVSVQLCLSLLSHLLEVDTKLLTREVINCLMPSLRVVGNHHPQKHIRQHCLEVQIAASTFNSITNITKSELAGSSDFVTSGDLERIMTNLQEQERKALSALSHAPITVAAKDALGSKVTELESTSVPATGQTEPEPVAARVTAPVAARVTAPTPVRAGKRGKSKRGRGTGSQTSRPRQVSKPQDEAAVTTKSASADGEATAMAESGPSAPDLDSLSAQAFAGSLYKQKYVLKELELNKFAEELARIPAEMAAEGEKIRREAQEFAVSMEARMSDALEKAMTDYRDGKGIEGFTRLSETIGLSAETDEKGHVATGGGHDEVPTKSGIMELDSTSLIGGKPVKTETATAANELAAASTFSSGTDAAPKDTSCSNDDRTQKSTASATSVDMPIVPVNPAVAPTAAVADSPEQKHSLKILMDELEHASLSIKARALHLIGQLLQTGEKAAWNNVDTLADIFLEHLSHSQLVIYMSSITGMALLSNERPELMIARICQEVKKSHDADTRLPLDGRVFMAQSLLQMARIATNKLQKYRPTFTHAMMACIQDDNVLVRTTALTCLQESVQYLEGDYSPATPIGIVKVLTAVLQHDTEIQSRQTAAAALKEIVTYVGIDLLENFSDDNTSLIRLISKMAKDDGDELVRNRCQSAIDALCGPAAQSASDEPSPFSIRPPPNTTPASKNASRPPKKPKGSKS